MPNQVAHFAINADDINRARAFYEKVFGWKFNAWGPPGFYMIEVGAESPRPLLGSLQKRRELSPGVPIYGFECTIAVEDVDATAVSVQANGGEILMKRVTIPTVGHLIWFRDTEGNIAGAMQYDSSADL